MTAHQTLRVTWQGRGSDHAAHEVSATANAAGVGLTMLAGPFGVTLTMTACQARTVAEMLVRAASLLHNDPDGPVVDLAQNGRGGLVLIQDGGG